MTARRKIAVIGLGYVGLPVAVAFASGGFQTLGFDIDRRRVAELKSGHDRTREVGAENLHASKLDVTADPEALKACDFFIVTVPTPIDEARTPDLSIVHAATRTIGAVLKRGDIVVYESTVYPGVTEDECVPILEAVSNLRFGSDFTVGYSPERINPGDKEHNFTSITKVVSGSDAETLDIVADTYGAVVRAGIHRAPSIRTAEAAKVIENTQRDLNIALMNELAVLFPKMGVDTGDVLAAAATKWNFLPFRPGLVGGHCIGVDPYYLTYKAQKLGLHPEVILAGRRANDTIGAFIVGECVKRLMKSGRADPVVTVLGVTFKEDVPDIRNSRVVDIVRGLAENGVEVQVVDPEADAEEVHHEYGFALTPLDQAKPADSVVFAVAHKTLVSLGWPRLQALLRDGRGCVLDVKGRLERSSVPSGVELWRL
jgi:UDP-N-acetyl-D-galactosamine dehydrogenase